MPFSLIILGDYISLVYCDAMFVLTLESVEPLFLGKETGIGRFGLYPFCAEILMTTIIDVG